jgi:hypothetical protein
MHLGVSVFNMAELTLNKHDKSISVKIIDTQYNVEFPRLHPAFLGIYMGINVYVYVYVYIYMYM